MSGIEISKKLVLINSASSVVVLVLNLSVLLWLQQYLLKRITPEEYALFPLVMAGISFAPLLTMVLTGGLGRYITVAYARGDNEEVTRICSTMFPLLLGGGIVLLLLGWLAAWHIDKLLKIPLILVPEARYMLALLVFSAALRLPYAIFSSGFMVRQKLMLRDIIDVGCQLFRFGLLFALLFSVGPRVLWVTVALVASDLLNLFISTPISMRLVPAQRVKRGYFRWSIAKKITSYGGWGLLDQIAQTLRLTMDPLILNRFASAMDVSVFYVAGIVPRQLTSILTPLSRPFIPILAGMYATGDLVRLTNTYLRVARYHSWVLLTFIVPGIVFSNELISLYLGDKYKAAGAVMTMLLLATGLSGFNALGPAIVAAAGDMKGISQRLLTIQVANLLLTILFVVYFLMGAMGSALATLAASFLIETTIVWPYCRRESGVSTTLWLREVVVPGAVPALLPMIFCLVVKIFIPVQSWSVLITVSIISGLINILMVVLWGLRIQDRIDLERACALLPLPIGGLIKWALRLK